MGLYMTRARIHAPAILGVVRLFKTPTLNHYLRVLESEIKMKPHRMPDMSTELMREEALNHVRQSPVAFLVCIEVDHEPGTEPGISILSWGGDLLETLDESDYELACRVIMAQLIVLQYLKVSGE